MSCLLAMGWASGVAEKQQPGGAAELAKSIAEMKELIKASGGEKDERMALGAVVDYVPANKRKPMPPLSPKLRTAAEFAM